MDQTDAARDLLAACPATDLPLPAAAAADGVVTAALASHAAHEARLVADLLHFGLGLDGAAWRALLRRQAYDLNRVVHTALSLQG